MNGFVTDIRELKEMLADARGGRWCSHCKYWQEFGPPEDFPIGSISYDGLCRRHPPERVPDDESGWPTTSYRDWCGEYALNKTPALARYIEELAHDQPADEQP